MASYSFKDVTATLAGPPGVTLQLGYGATVAEEGIDIESVDADTMTIGADGEVMHSLHADKSGKITVRLLKVSPMMAALMALFDAQRASSSLWGQNVILVGQTVAGDISTGLQCAFTKKPDLKYAKAGDIIPWVFNVGKLDSVLGTY